MSESRPTQQCPICGASQPLAARKCSICGATLPGELTPVAPLPVVESLPQKGARPLYDPALGDDDLFVGDLAGRMWRLILVGGIVLALVLGLGIGVVISQFLGDEDDDPVFTEGIEQGPSATQQDGTFIPSAIPTNTPRTPSSAPTWTLTPKMLDLPTITPVPPTPTITPTPEPCYQTAWAGATIFEMALKCGHVDWSVVDVILEMNDMESAAELRENQTLEIPWPTPTPGGDPAQQSSDAGAEAGDSMALASEPVLNEFGTPDRLAQYQNVEPTLRPGQKWHVIQAGETIAGIAYQYDTTVEILSQINPEIPFLQCDYGQTYGGPNCSVMLYEGQSLRVPVLVPTPEPTATPGTRTPTPQPTPTYNAPYVIAPENEAHFNGDQIVTLRWNGTGTLAANERYVVRVLDRDTGENFLALVPDTFYSLPGGWQPDDGNRHTLEWTVSIGTIDADFNVVDEYDMTTPRRFTWNSR